MSLLTGLLLFIIIYKCSCTSQTLCLIHGWLPFSSKRWLKDFDFSSLCQTRSEEKFNKSCVLQAITVKYLILTEETEVNKENKMKAWALTASEIKCLQAKSSLNYPNISLYHSPHSSHPFRIRTVSGLSFCTIVSNPTKFTEAPPGNVLYLLSCGLQKWGEKECFYWV